MGVNETNLLIGPKARLFDWCDNSYSPKRTMEDKKKALKEKLKNETLEKLKKTSSITIRVPGECSINEVVKWIEELDEEIPYDMSISFDDSLPLLCNDCGVCVDCKTQKKGQLYVSIDKKTKIGSKEPARVVVFK